MAYNSKAWEIAKQAVNNDHAQHSMTIIGPCCETCSIAYRIAVELLSAEDALYDATDFAHPAWWRGYTYASLAVIDKVTSVFNGEDEGGVASGPWQLLRSRLHDISDMLSIAEKAIYRLPYADPLRIQWYKIRGEYCKAVEKTASQGDPGDEHDSTRS